MTANRIMKSPLWNSEKLGIRMIIALNNIRMHPAICLVLINSFFHILKNKKEKSTSRVSITPTLPALVYLIPKNWRSGKTIPNIRPAPTREGRISLSKIFDNDPFIPPKKTKKIRAKSMDQAKDAIGVNLISEILVITGKSEARIACEMINISPALSLVKVTMCLIL